MKKIIRRTSCVIRWLVLMIGMNAWQVLGLESGTSRLLMVNQWGEQLTTVEQTREFVTSIKHKQIKGAGLAVPWKFIETEPGRYDFSWLDERLDLFVEAGLYFHLRVDCSRFYQPEWLSAHMMQTVDGRTWSIKGNLGIYQCLSFADPEVIAAVARFTAVTAKHVWERYSNVNPHPLVHLYPMFTTCAETEYPFENKVDYSPAAQKAFRAWLAETFGAVGQLNFKWDTQFTEWSQIRLQQAPAWDLQRFRTEILGRQIDSYASAVHHVCPAPVGCQFGSVWDHLSLRRGTLDVTRLSRNLDWVAFDDDLSYDFAFSTDYIRGMIPGKQIAGETGGPWKSPATGDRVIEYVRESYAHGMHAVYVANLNSAGILNPEWTFWPEIVEESHRPVAHPVPRKAIVVSLATLYNMPDKTSVESLVRDMYLRLSENHRIPVDFVNDTLIADHFESLKQYSDGLFVPDTMTAMTDSLLKALENSPVPVAMDRTKAGIFDEYGKARKEHR